MPPYALKVQKVENNSGTVNKPRCNQCLPVTTSVEAECLFYQILIDAVDGTKQAVLFFDIVATKLRRLTALINTNAVDSSK